MYPHQSDRSQPDMKNPSPYHHGTGKSSCGEKSIRPACSTIVHARRRTLAMITVLLGSVVLLSACNPITSQNIKLSAAAASGTGAGMMRPMNGIRDAGMRELANPDLIGRVVSVDGKKVKVELLESSTNKARSATPNNNSTTPNRNSDTTITGTPGSSDTATRGTNGSDYTATGERKTITMADSVRITQMSTLMERSSRGGSMDRSADGAGGGNWIGGGSRSDRSATGTSQQGNANDPASTGVMGSTGNPATPGDPTGGVPGNTSGDGSLSDRTQHEQGAAGSDMAANEAELKAGDIVMIWYEEGVALAKRIVILPLQ
ncbi:hypothetical protein [Paenibacillus wenxiniae]